MKTTSQTITNLLTQQIPDYVQEFYPLFVIFVTKYFEFLENSSNGVQYQLQNIRLNRDIDTTANDLAVEFLNTYVPNLPNASAVDQTILVKYFRDFYRRKGSESSFKFFFRAFFGEDIEIIYPRDFMFNTSGGDWYTERTIRVRSNTGDPLNLIHTYVTGLTSNASAVIDGVVKPNAVGGTDRYDLIIQPGSQLGVFSSSEAIVGIYYDYANNVSSTVSVTSITGVVTASGVYKNTRSQLSNDQVLQDSLYYQQFSYVIRSRKDRETWGNSILNHLNPSGIVMFNDFLDDVVSTNADATMFSRNSLAETTVRIPSIKSYLASPTYTFDRIGDLYTGTSTTRIYLANGTTTSVTYTSIGAITYSNTFDYNGENITWALQRDVDVVTFGLPTTSKTEIIRFNGPSFDKFLKTITIDDSYIAWSREINSSIVNTRYVAVSSTLTAGTLLTSFATTVNFNVIPVTSVLLVLTWMKNTQGNNAAGESNNAVVVSISSNSTLVTRFNDEWQRNYRNLAVGRSLEYNNLVFVNSSNSITAFNVTSDIPLSSSVTNARWVFKPYNWERGQTYDRMIIEIEMDQALQLNTSLTETFNTVNVTASGLIASWTGVTTSASVGFFGTASTTRTTFSSNVFVFNNELNSSRSLQTVAFPGTQILNLGVSYVAGDNFNGGDVTETGENLVVQYSTDGGTNWTTASTLWFGGSSWTNGVRTFAGQVFVSSGGTTIQGADTLFNTDYDVGDVFTLLSSTTTTAYTIISITNNNLMTVSPAVVTNTSGTILGGANFTTALGTITRTNNGDGTWNFVCNSSVTSVLRATGLTALSSRTITIQIRIRLNSNTTPAIPFIVDYGDGPSRTLTLVQGDWTTTSFTITGGPAGTLDLVSDVAAGFNFDLDYVRINGLPAFFRPPVAQQFINTSITVYSGAAVTAIARVIQTQPTGSGLNQDLYAIDNLTVSSFRTQGSSGTVNIGIAVSSNSTLNINDTDFFNITTIGG